MAIELDNDYSEGETFLGIAVIETDEGFVGIGSIIQDGEQLIDLPSGIQYVSLEEAASDVAERMGPFVDHILDDVMFFPVGAEKGKYETLSLDTILDD